MTKFAFIVHPLYPKQIAKRFPLAKFLPDSLIEKLLTHKSPFIAGHITGIKSITGAETEGWFIGCPLTPRMMIDTLPLEVVYSRISQCADMAKELGAELIGLGAFTSVVGDGGITIAERTSIAVTTGNSYTVATAITGTLEACDQIGIDRKRSVLAIVGATGSIGKTCAKMLAPEFAKTLVIGRDLERTKAIADELPNGVASVNVADLKEADAIITVTSTDAAIIMPEHLKVGAMICDVARPRDVSGRVGKERPDVLVIEGGVVLVPGDVDFGLDFGFPAKTAYACMSETMMLALDGRPESFTLGKTVSVEQVQETLRLADKHGFKLAGFRSFEHAVPQEARDRVRIARQKQPQPATV